MSLPVYFAFLLACAVVMIGPSPALTLIVASRLRHGCRVGMLNAAGIQLGLAFTVGVVLLGLASLIAAMDAWFVRVCLAGAAAWSSCRVFQQAPYEAKRITIVLPPNIAITTKPQVSIAKAGATPIELAWQRCTPGGCFTSAPLSDEAIGAFGAQTEPGRIVKDARLRPRNNKGEYTSAAFARPPICPKRSSKIWDTI
jgi:Invasion associated locus B (IalB) protein